MCRDRNTGRGFFFFVGVGPSLSGWQGKYVEAPWIALSPFGPFSPPPFFFFFSLPPYGGIMRKEGNEHGFKGK